MLVRWLFAITLYPAAVLAVRVLKTDSSQFLPKLSDQADVLNSGLAGYEEVTVCARFLTHQFNCHKEAYDYQGLITVSEFWLLGSYLALPCDWYYDGCTVYKKSYIPGWTHGTALGYYEASNFYRAWEPGRWNSFCFTGSALVNQSRVFINGEQRLALNNYPANHKKSGANIRLMNNHLSENPHHGAMTDVNVWSRILSDTELSSWAACGQVQGEKVVDWDNAELNVTGLEAGLELISGGKFFMTSFRRVLLGRVDIN